MKTSLGNKLNAMNKALTTQDGLTYYDLTAPSKLLAPFLTPLRNKLTRKPKPQAGVACHWKSILAVTGSGYDGMGWVPEGQRSGVLNYAATDKLAAYTTLGEESALTFEAESAAQGFEDENANNTFILLEKMMLKEETALLGGNKSIALGTPATPTASAAGSGGTLAGATYSIIVVALTQEGYQNYKATGSAAIIQQKNITGADGNTYTANGGNSNKSAAASQAVTLGQILTVNCTAIRGAVAYAWYVGTSGSETLQSVTANTVTTFSTPLVSGQPISAITGDHSYNDGTGGSNPVTAFDGLMTTAFAAGNNAYYSSLGATLTSTGAASIVEIDLMFKTMWDAYQVSPTVLWVNAQQLQDIRNKVLNGNSAPLLRINQDANGRGYDLTAGGTITWYYNPFGINGGQNIPVMLHPTLAPGTILAYAEQLPTYYKSNETPVVAEVLTRRDYYRIDWPLRTRQREYGVYSEECLAVYAPFAMGVISNIVAG
jgi:hypothetical protein